MSEATKPTRKELFVRIKEEMANDPEVVEMCDKYIDQLSRERKPRVNEAAEEFAAKVREMMDDMEEGVKVTNKEMVEKWNAIHEDAQVSAQKMAAAFRKLVKNGSVEKHEGEKPKDPCSFSAK